MKKELKDGKKSKLFIVINFIKKNLSFTGLLFVLFVCVAAFFLVEFLEEMIGLKIDIGNILAIIMVCVCLLIFLCKVCSLLRNIITIFHKQKSEIDYEDKKVKSKFIKIVFDLYLIFYLAAIFSSASRYIVLLNFILIIISIIFYCFSKRKIYKKIFSKRLNKKKRVYLHRKDHNNFNSLMIMIFTNLIWFFFSDGYYYNKRFVITCIIGSLIFTVFELIVIKEVDGETVITENNTITKRKSNKIIITIAILIVNSLFVATSVRYINSNFGVRKIDSFNATTCEKRYSSHTSNKYGNTYTFTVTNPNNGNQYEFNIDSKDYYLHAYDSANVRVYKGIFNLEWARIDKE